MRELHEPNLRSRCLTLSCVQCLGQAGDVIYIEANSGAVKRVGRCDAYATEFDLEAEEYVPLPKVCIGPCLHEAVQVA